MLVLPCPLLWYPYVCLRKARYLRTVIRYASSSSTPLRLAAGARGLSSAGLNHARAAVLAYICNDSRASYPYVGHTANRAFARNLSLQALWRRAKLWSRGAGWRRANTRPSSARVAPSARLVSGREPHTQRPISFDAPRPSYVSPRNPLQLSKFELCQRSGVRIKSGLCVAVGP